MQRRNTNLDRSATHVQKLPVPARDWPKTDTRNHTLSITWTRKAVSCSWCRRGQESAALAGIQQGTEHRPALRLRHRHTSGQNTVVAAQTQTQTQT
eukprot:1477685-Rhodomonas_salina.2